MAEIRDGGAIAYRRSVRTHAKGRGVEATLPKRVFADDQGNINSQLLGSREMWHFPSEDVLLIDLGGDDGD
jgi:hypothetical protein